MSLPQGYTIRRVTPADHKDISAVLTALTTVGETSESEFAQLCAYWDTLKTLDGKHHVYNVHVIVDDTGRVVATGNLLIEQKLIRSAACAGHIEDIAVAADQQGKKLGKFLIAHLTHVAKEAGCYKVILDCSEHNVGFYERCGYKNEGVEMAIRL